MNNKPAYLSKEGLDKLRDELNEMTTIRRAEVAARIQEAKEHGDITENAEYEDAKNEQAFVEGRIQALSALIKNAVLILEPGWLEGMAVNTIEPSPLGEASADGRLTLQLGHIPKGSSHLLFMQFQVNPTNLAWRRSADVRLADGSTPLLRIRHHFTIYP